MKLMALWLVLLVSLSSGALDDAQLTELEDFGQDGVGLHHPGKMGEAAEDAAGFPSPFAPPMPPAGGYASIGTVGYARQFNRYGMTPIDCGGNQDANGNEPFAPHHFNADGSVNSDNQFYGFPTPASPGMEHYYCAGQDSTCVSTALLSGGGGETAGDVDDGTPSDLSRCVELCNACDGCAGFVDAINLNLCIFASTLDYTEITMTSPFNDVRLYFNKVKTYAACQAGYTSEEEAEACQECAAGKSSVKGGPCETCGVGLYTDETAQPSCSSCPAGYVPTSEHDGCDTCDVVSTQLGIYSPGGVDDCIECSIGEYQDVVGSSGCKDCSSGKVSDAASTVCKICVAGYYVPTGVKQDTCTTCSDGYYTAMSPNDVQCVACPGGQYQTGPSDGCKHCGPGTISQSAYAACVNCAAGKYMEGTNSGGSHVSCSTCPDGHSQGEEGQNECPQCPQGYFNPPASGSNDMSVCTLCPAGDYADAQQSHCKVCDIGKHAPTPGSFSCTNCLKGYFAPGQQETGCTACPLGFAQSSDVAGSCINCPAGKYGPSDAQTQCTDCLAGTYLDTNTEVNVCKTCFAGFYSNEEDSDSCKSCPIGWISPSTSTLCSQCTAGRMSNHYYSGGLVPGTDCTICLAGKESTAGFDQCTDCLGGYYSADEQEDCTQCISGTYQDEVEQVECKNCAAGKHSASNAAAICVDCISGKYSPAAAAICTTCLTGEKSDSPWSACDNCQPGYYATAGDATCTICPGGYNQVNEKEGDCDDCSAGLFSMDGASGCDSCPGGFISQHRETVCGACGVGTISLGGVGADSCELCPMAFYQNITASTHCVDCPPGAVSQPGSEQCTFCGSGTKVSDDGGSCEPCPAGKGAPPGSDECQDCQPGMYSDDGTPECEDCLAGRFTAEIEMSTCSNCTAGDYAPGLGNSVCTACTLGFYSAEDLADTCEECPAGKQSNAANTFCTLCSEGQFKDTSGTGYCKECPAGKFEITQGEIVCDACPEGWYQHLTGLTQCEMCDVGRYNDATDQSACKDCSPGKSSNNAHEVSCFDCSAGKVSVTDPNPGPCVACAAGRKQVSGNICEQCPDGKFQDSGEMTDCIDCYAGQIAPNSDGNSVSCEPCGRGAIPDADNTNCVDCAAGRHRGLASSYMFLPNSVGLTAVYAHCTDCATGKYGDEAEADTADGYEVCKACGAGQYGLNPTSEGAPQSGCTACEVGKYADTDGQGVNCKTCGLGMYQSTTGATFCDNCTVGDAGESIELSQCRTCPGGFYANPIHDECAACTIGYYSIDGVAECTLCTAGTESSPGKTACDNCDPGKFSDLGLECKDCATGEYSSKGDNACSVKFLACYSFQTTPSGWTQMADAATWSAAKTNCDGYEYISLSCPRNDGSGDVFEVWCGNDLPNGGKLPDEECAGVTETSSQSPTNVGQCDTASSFRIDGKLAGGYQRGAVYPNADAVVGPTRGSTDCEIGYQNIQTEAECNEAAIALGKMWQHDAVDVPTCKTWALPGCITGPLGGLTNGFEASDHTVYWNTCGAANTGAVHLGGAQGYPVCLRPVAADYDNTQHTIDFEKVDGGAATSLSNANMGGLAWETESGATMASMPLVEYTTSNTVVSTSVATATTTTTETKKFTDTSNDYLLRTDFNYATVDQYDGNTPVGVFKSSPFKLGLGAITFEASGNGGYVDLCLAETPATCLTGAKTQISSTQDLSEAYTCSNVDSWTDYPAANQDQDDALVPDGGFGSCSDNGWSKKGNAYKKGTSIPCTSGDFFGAAAAELGGGHQWECSAAGSWTSYALDTTPTASGEGWSKRAGTRATMYKAGTNSPCTAAGFWDTDGTLASECPVSHPFSFNALSSCCSHQPTTIPVWTLYPTTSGKGYCLPYAPGIGADDNFEQQPPGNGKAYHISYSMTTSALTTGTTGTVADYSSLCAQRTGGKPLCAYTSQHGTNGGNTCGGRCVQLDECVDCLTSNDLTTSVGRQGGVFMANEGTDDASCGLADDSANMQFLVGWSSHGLNSGGLPMWCMVEKPQGDYKAMLADGITPVDTALKCNKACEETSGCKYATFRETQSPAVADCYLSDMATCNWATDSGYTTYETLTNAESCPFYDHVGEYTVTGSAGDGACHDSSDSNQGLVPAVLKSTYELGETGCRTACNSWEHCAGYTYSGDSASESQPRLFPQCMLHHYAPISATVPLPTLQSDKGATWTDVAYKVGTTITETTCTGGDDAALDLDCGDKCRNEATCQFWIRSQNTGNGCENNVCKCYLRMDYDNSGAANDIAPGWEALAGDASNNCDTYDTEVNSNGISNYNETVRSCTKDQDGNTIASSNIVSIGATDKATCRSQCASTTGCVSIQWSGFSGSFTTNGECSLIKAQCHSDATNSCSECTTHCQDNERMIDYAPFRGAFVNRDWEEYDDAASCSDCIIGAATIPSSANREDISGFNPTCHKKKSAQWCDGSQVSTSVKTAKCEANGELPTDCEYAECSGAGVTITATIELPDVPNVYPTAQATGQSPFAGGDDTCPCMTENLAACSYACCPAGTFSTSADNCVGGNCAMPFDAGSAANFPSDCPCANKNTFYNMQEYTIDQDLLASWAGFDVILKIADEQTGDDGFVAVDNIKFHGKVISCVDLVMTGGVVDWTAYTEDSATFPLAGFGTGEGWSRITDPDATYGYAAGTKSPCERANFLNTGSPTSAACEYASCPAGAITATEAMCLAFKTAAECSFPASGTVADWPSACPCIQQ